MALLQSHDHRAQRKFDASAFPELPRSCTGLTFPVAITLPSASVAGNPEFERVLASSRPPMLPDPRNSDFPKKAKRKYVNKSNTIPNTHHWRDAAGEATNSSTSTIQTISRTKLTKKWESEKATQLSAVVTRWVGDPLVDATV